MFLLKERQIQDALYMFKEIVLTADNDFGDRFFSIFAPGNSMNVIDKPYERFHDYECLLQKLQEEAPEKYSEIHKGTPFYFLGWLAFDMGNYDRGLFYIDAALSEDIKNTRRKGCPNMWKKQPAYLAIRLEDRPYQVAQRSIVRIKRTLKRELERFNEIASPSELEGQITVGTFVDKFVSPLVEKEIKAEKESSDMKSKPYRSLVTAFYAFLLEFQGRCTELALRSDEGGSIEPFIVHLFRGGLLFESLLKYFYKQPDNKEWNTISNIFRGDSQFQKDFGEFPTHATTAEDLESIIGDIGDVANNSLEKAFTTTARLRNTAGHNLVWSGVFSDPVNYRRLVKQEINALFYIIRKKFLL
jgi:hypothetical protein